MRKSAGVLAVLGSAVAVFAMPLAMPSAAQSAKSATLDSLKGSQWTLRMRDGSASRNVCVRSGRELIQLRHQGGSCKSFVVSDQGGSVTVHYTCPGNGYGRTTIKRETGSIVQIQSQGIEGGLPFEFSAEARRGGACS